jgi:hypothetical protein
MTTHKTVTIYGDRCQDRITNRNYEVLGLTEQTKQATTATVFDKISEATTILSKVIKQTTTIKDGCQSTQGDVRSHRIYQRS